MDSNEASKTLLRRGKPETFPLKQAERILDLQKRTGLKDYKDPADQEPADDDSATEPQTDSSDAPDGPTGNTSNPEPEKRSGTKKGG